MVHSGKFSNKLIVFHKQMMTNYHAFVHHTHAHAIFALNFSFIEGFLDGVRTLVR